MASLEVTLGEEGERKLVQELKEKIDANPELAVLILEMLKAAGNDPKALATLTENALKDLKSALPELKIAQVFPGMEIKSASFATRLIQSSSHEYPHVAFEIVLLRHDSEPISIQDASSSWLEELHDMLDVVLKQTSRNGQKNEYIALGLCMGVHVVTDYDKEPNQQVVRLSGHVGHGYQHHNYPSQTEQP